MSEGETGNNINGGKELATFPTLRIICLLVTACSDAVRDSLHRSFHLTACLATFLRTQAISPVDAITLQVCHQASGVSTLVMCTLQELFWIPYTFDILYCLG